MSVVTRTRLFGPHLLFSCPYEYISWWKKQIESEEGRIPDDLLPSTVTALVTFVLVDGTIVLMLTYVGCIFSNAPPKKPFATIAWNGSIMLPCHQSKNECYPNRNKATAYLSLDRHTQHNLTSHDCSRRCYCSLNWFLEPLFLTLLVRHDQDQDIRHWFHVWYSSLFHRSHCWERHVALEYKKKEESTR